MDGGIILPTNYEQFTKNEIELAAFDLNIY